MSDERDFEAVGRPVAVARAGVPREQGLEVARVARVGAWRVSKTR